MAHIAFFSGKKPVIFCIGHLKAFLTRFLLCVCVFAVAPLAAENDRPSCLGNSATLNQWPVVHAPKRVLLIPLLHKKAGTNENPRWPEQPAAVLEKFYRSRFHAEVVWMSNIRSWENFYIQANRLRQNSPPFDRVILIGHSGFDGPVLKKTLIRQSLTVKDGEGNVFAAVESQPGKQQIFSLTYDIAANRIFTDYIAENWRALIDMEPADASQQLEAMKIRLQPMDNACFQRYCSSGHLASAWNEEDKRVMLNTCGYICRKPLFVLKMQEEIIAERFYQFADNLKALVRQNGLIFLGGCNPGTVPVEDIPSEWFPGALSQSGLAGGPHNTYVHLFAAATGRVTAGPIGDSSADDIVRRVIALESNRPQHYLCVESPVAR